VLAAVLITAMLTSVLASCRRAPVSNYVPPEFIFVPEIITLPDGVSDIRNIVYANGRLIFVSNVRVSDDPHSWETIPKLFTMNLDGTNIITIIKPDHYVLLRSLEIRGNWLYYMYSWRDRSRPFGENLHESIRKVRLDGTDDKETRWSVFGGDSESVQIWLNGDFVIWQITSWVTTGRVTRQFLYIAPINRIEEAIEIFDGKGWESHMGYYIWNGNIYIFIKSWR